MITPVLLCGGSGTRLWPLSRKSYPKQFSQIVGEESLFQAAACRFVGAGFTGPLIVSNDRFRFIVSRQLAENEIDPVGTLIEPDGRNTAPAAIAAALYLHAKNPDSLMLIVPSDHVVADPSLFRDAVKKGAVAAREGQIVTFGIVPTRPEIGFGWLESGGDTHPGVKKLKRFVEKPDMATAEKLIKDPSYLWNAGVFLARADVMIEAFRAYAPEIMNSVSAALDAAKDDLSFTRLDQDLWENVPEDSIDYAIMEKANNVSIAPFDGHWSDLGGWEAVWQETPHDEDGNAITENTTTFNCKNTLLRSENDAIEVVGIGLKNIVAIAMPDAVMVADISQSQGVKKAVQVLKQRKVKQAEQLPVDHRPWGWFETLILSNRFQVKRIHVYPGAALSLQSHVHRSEHWIVVAGTARVTVDDEVKLLSENQSIYIPLGAVHRMENPGKVPMVLIEVQTGSYLGEDDIIRYEDIYARN